MTEDFEILAAKLITLFSHHNNTLEVVSHSATGIYTQVPGRKGPDAFFGSVSIAKNYVSFHLMPVYIFPELLNPVNLQLKKRMQGKSCFNFKKISEIEFEGLRELVEACVNKYRAAGYLAG